MLVLTPGAGRYLCAAAMLAGFGALTACHGGTTTSPGAASGAPTTTAAAKSGWTTVATFRGDGGSDGKGADFTIPAGKVRVMWTVQPNDVGPVPLMWEIDGVLNGAEVPYGGTGCASCDGQQTYDVGPFRAGTYHLKVLTSRPWTLTVEEQS